MSVSRPVRARWSSRLAAARSGDDGFALILALLMILMITAVSLSMAAVILRQVQPTQEARKSLQTVNAAQSGLQVAVGNLRQATTVDPITGLTKGLLTKLRCTPGGASLSTGTSAARVAAPGTTYRGTVDASAGAPTYEVSVSYFRGSPAGMTPAQLAAAALPCPLREVPLYAYLQAYGTGAQVPGNTAGQGSRSQVATYQFSTNNINVVGGLLRSYGTQQCIDAGLLPVAGRLLTMQPCLALGAAQQTWQYRKDLSLFYGGDTALNLCISRPTSGAQAVLSTCSGTGSGDTYPYAPGQQVQEWGFNDNGHFAAARPDGTVTNGGDGMCLQPQGAGGVTAAPSGAPLVIVTCDTNTTGPAAFDPDPQVGAGKAGGAINGLPGATEQFVSYAQFGRCLDITGQNVDADHLIAYPCKQAPDSTTIAFNQRWTFELVAGGYGEFFVVRNGVKYCLTAPTQGNLVTTTPCSPGKPTAQEWKATGEVPGDYARSFNLVAQRDGACLAVSPLSEALTNSASNIIIDECDGSSAQKWNAPPGEPDSRIGSIAETVGG